MWKHLHSGYGRRLTSRGHGFKSQHQMMDVHFYMLICCKIGLFILERRKRGWGLSNFRNKTLAYCCWQDFSQSSPKETLFPDDDFNKCSFFDIFTFCFRHHVTYATNCSTSRQSLILTNPFSFGLTGLIEKGINRFNRKMGRESVKKINRTYR